MHTSPARRRRSAPPRLDDRGDEEREPAVPSEEGVEISVRIVEKTDDAGGMAITVQWRPKDAASSINPCGQGVTETPQKRERQQTAVFVSSLQAPSPPQGASHRPRKCADAVPHLHHALEGLFLPHSGPKEAEHSTKSPTRSPGESVQKDSQLSLKRARLLRILSATASEEDLVLSRPVFPSASPIPVRVDEACERPTSPFKLDQQQAPLVACTDDKTEKEQAGDLSRSRTLPEEIDVYHESSSTSACTSSTGGDVNSPSGVVSPGGSSLAADARSRLQTLLAGFAADEAIRFPQEMACSQAARDKSRQSAPQDSPRRPRAAGLDSEGTLAPIGDCGGAQESLGEDTRPLNTPDSVDATISPSSIAARRKTKRHGAMSPDSESGPPPLDMNAVTAAGINHTTASESAEGVVIASLSPSMVRVHSELINQGAGGLPELSHNTSPLLGRQGPGASPASWHSMSLLSSIVSTPASAAQAHLSVTLSPLAGTRLQGSTLQQTPLSQSAGAGASVSSWWTGDKPYPTSVMTRRFQSLQLVTARPIDSEGSAAASPMQGAMPAHADSNHFSAWISEEACVLRPSPSQRSENSPGSRVEASSGDGEWKIYPGGARRVLPAPPSPDSGASKVGAPPGHIRGNHVDPEKAGASATRAQAALYTSSLWARVLRRGPPGAVAMVQRKKERVRGSARQATHVFRVVHPDGVQYRKSPHMEARVYARKWWDYERTAAGPNFGDLVNVSSLQGNWVQVAGNGLWLPITGNKGKQQALLELVSILGAYQDHPQAYSAGGTGVGGWNPMLSSRMAILSLDRRAVYFGAGRPAVALAEAGFDAGRHVTVVKILSMQELGYIGVTELPSNSNIVNTSHLGVFGIAVGGSSHKAKETGPIPTRAAASSRRAAPLTASPADASRSPDRGQEDAGQLVRLRIWMKGILGQFVEPFRQGDEVALLLDMTARTLDYFVNRRFVGRTLAHCHASNLLHMQRLPDVFVQPDTVTSPHLLRLTSAPALSGGRRSPAGKDRYLLFGGLQCPFHPF